MRGERAGRHPARRRDGGGQLGRARYERLPDALPGKHNGFGPWRPQTAKDELPGRLRSGGGRAVRLDAVPALAVLPAHRAAEGGVIDEL
jgi:hypothetical protein